MIDDPDVVATVGDIEVRWRPNAPAIYELYEVQRMRQLPTIKFQEGTIPEEGVNGVTVETLLTIAMHQMDESQSDPILRNTFNEQAIIQIMTALSYLNTRTELRKLRGVEGTKKP